MKRLCIIMVLLVLSVHVHAENESPGDAGDESTTSTIEGETTTSVEYFENQEEIKERATDVLQVLMRIVGDVLEEIRDYLLSLPVTE